MRNRIVVVVQDGRVVNVYSNHKDVYASVIDLDCTDMTDDEVQDEIRDTFGSDKPHDVLY